MEPADHVGVGSGSGGGGDGRPAPPSLPPDGTDAFLHDGGVQGALGDAKAASLLEKLLAVVGPRLVALRLPKNKLSESASYFVSRVLPEFPMLRELDLHGNQLGYVGATVVAQSVCECANLVSLKLSRNLIGGKDSRALMTHLLGERSRLRFLDLSDNRLGNEGMETLAPLLRVNRSLQELLLCGCAVTEPGVNALMRGIAENGTVSVLDLSRNTLRKSKALTDAVRDALFRNTSLQQVVVPEVTSQSSLLDELIFLRNQNAAFRKAELGDAGLAYFSERMWLQIPSSVFRVTTLSKLDVSNNRLAGLPYSIVLIPSLEWLNISHNCIELDAIPIHCSELPRLHTLRVEGNPFVKHIPGRFDWQSIEDLFDYFNYVAETRLSGLGIKTLVLGASGSGKTRVVASMTQVQPPLQVTTAAPAASSTLRRLLKLKGSAQPEETVAQRDSEAGGVSVTSVTLPLPDRRAYLNVWDFNVPEMENHPMVQFYMSDSAFYVVVVNASNPEWRESINVWKNAIEGRANVADVFFVVTHKDRSQSTCANVLKEIMRDFVPTRAARRPHGSSTRIVYHGAWGVSANSPKDALPLLERMATIANQRAEQNSIPAPWAITNSVLAEEARVIPFPIISYSRFETIALCCGLIDDECGALAKYLHESGAILHYSGVKKLHDVVILSPTWLLKVSSRLFSYGRVHCVNGTFRVHDVPEIWPSHDFPSAAHDSILRLLEAFEVLNPLGTVFVMPYLVPDQAPADMLLPLENMAMAARYKRVYVFDTSAQLPRTFTSQLIIRLLEISSRAYHIWQSGVVFSLTERSFTHAIAAYVKYDKKRLIFHVASTDRSGKVLHIIHSTTESLLDGWYRSIGYEVFAKSGKVSSSLDELSKVSLQMKNKVNVAIDEDLAPDILMKSTYRIHWPDMEQGEFIAAGAFGSVSHGRYRGVDVVVKRMLTLEQMSEPEMYNSFLKECWAMSFLQHECIIQLLGISLEPLCMVMELMTLRDLRHFLDNYHEIPWSWRLKLLMDVARGMAYAHEQFPPIVHRDLKSPNVFLTVTDGVLIAKVADLGLATVLPKLIKNAVVENPTWSAPEVIAREPYSQSADVYSFAIVMWEVWTSEFPFEDLWNQTQFTTEIIKSICSGRRPNARGHVAPAPPGYQELMKSAWSHHEGDRPNFNQLVQSLAAISAGYLHHSTLMALTSLSSSSLLAPTAVSSATSSPSKVPSTPSVPAAGAVARPPSTLSLKLLFRVPRSWVGLACALPGSVLMTLREGGKFDVQDLTTDSVVAFSHLKTYCPLRSAVIVAVGPATAWVIDGETPEVLVLETSGRSGVLLSPEILYHTAAVVVNGLVWTVGVENAARKSSDQVDDGEVRSIIHVWTPDVFVKKALAKVTGILRHGLHASNFSVYFVCERKNRQFYLWRMRLSDKACSKAALPGPATCIFDVLHRAEVWVVCADASVVVRFSYDLKEQGRTNVGCNVFQAGVYMDRFQTVVSIGTASMALWNCDSYTPFSIRSLSSESSGLTSRVASPVVPLQVHYLPTLGELVCVSADRTLLFLVQSAAPMPFVPVKRDVERSATLVERREKKTRTAVSMFEKEGVESARRHSFIGTYTADHRPMGLAAFFKSSSSENVRAEEFNALRSSPVLRNSLERSTSEESSSPRPDAVARRNRSRASSLTKTRPQRGSQSRDRSDSAESRARVRSNSGGHGTASAPHSAQGSSSATPRHRSGSSSPIATPRSAEERTPRRRVLSAGSLAPGPLSPRPERGGPRPRLTKKSSDRAMDLGGVPVSDELFAYQRSQELMSSRTGTAELEDGQKQSSPPAPLTLNLPAATAPEDPDPTADDGRKGLKISQNAVTVRRALPLTTVDSSDEELRSKSQSPVDLSPIAQPPAGLKSMRRSMELKKHRKSGERLPPKASAGPVGLLGLVDEKTEERLYGNEFKARRRGSLIRSKLEQQQQRNESGGLGSRKISGSLASRSRYQSFSSLTIGGVSMSVRGSEQPAASTASHATMAAAAAVPMVVPAEMPLSPGPMLSPTASYSEDVSDRGSSRTRFAFWRKPETAGGGREEKLARSDGDSSAPAPPMVDALRNAGGRERSQSWAARSHGTEGQPLGAPLRRAVPPLPLGASPPADTLKLPEDDKPGSRPRARSMGGPKDQAEALRIVREQLQARISEEVSVMKGRSGSVSGPGSVRGVPKNYQRLKRQMQGDVLSPVVSPPSSDESRRGGIVHGTFSPLSPSSGASSPTAKSSATSPRARSQTMGSAKLPPPRTSHPGADLQGLKLIDAASLERLYATRSRQESSTDAPVLQQAAFVSTRTEARPPAPLTSPTPPRSPPSKLSSKEPPRLSKLFATARKSGNAIDELISLDTRPHRSGSVSSTSVSTALRAVSEQVESSSSMEQFANLNRSQDTPVAVKRRSLGDEFDETAPVDDSESSNSGRKLSPARGAGAKKPPK